MLTQGPLNLYFLKLNGSLIIFAETFRTQTLSTRFFVNKIQRSPNFQTFKEPRNRSKGIDSATLCSLVGRYDNPIPTRFLVPNNCSKVPAQYYEILSRSWVFLIVKKKRSLRIRKSNTERVTIGWRDKPVPRKPPVFPSSALTTVLVWWYHRKRR